MEKATITPREILLDIEADLDLLASTMPNSIEAKVEAGSILWRMINVAKKTLDQIKEDLRQEAIKRPGGPAHTFVANGSTAIVKLPDTTLRLAEDADLETIRRTFGTTFGEYFEEQVTIKLHREFATRVASMVDEERRSLLLAAVDRVENTPRVSFRRSGR